MYVYFDYARTEKKNKNIIHFTKRKEIESLWILLLDDALHLTDVSKKNCESDVLM